MKKIIALTLLFSLFLPFSACAAEKTKEGAMAKTGATAAKTLVVFYSYSKNTAAVAKRIAERTGADLYEIRTVKAYPNDPYKTSDISREERRSGKMPEIVSDLPDLSRYGTVFVGGPIWNGTLATPLEAYLNKADFGGKTVVPFCTSMGSGVQSYFRDFKDKAKGAKEIGESLNVTFPGNARPTAFTDKELDAKLSGWIERHDK